ncbi:MAG: hypothetical protein AAFY81_10800, partial [Pseudomonadota bacterium]
MSNLSQRQIFAALKIFSRLRRGAMIVTPPKNPYLIAMTKSLKILVAQLNPVVGDIKGNKALAEAAHQD